jgi:hypothetical protein
MNNNNKAPHILNTSSNLLGLCFIVLTSVKVLKLQENTVIDDLASVCVFLFMMSSILSFLSIRNNNHRGVLYENIADYIFFGGLVVLFLTTVFITFNIIS